MLGVGRATSCQTYWGILPCFFGKFCKHCLIFPQTCLERRFWRSPSMMWILLQQLSCPPCLAFSHDVWHHQGLGSLASRMHFNSLRSFNSRQKLRQAKLTSKPNSLITFRQLPASVQACGGVFDVPSDVPHYVTMFQSQQNTVGSGHYSILSWSSCLWCTGQAKWHLAAHIAIHQGCGAGPHLWRQEHRWETDFAA